MYLNLYLCVYLYLLQEGCTCEAQPWTPYNTNLSMQGIKVGLGAGSFKDANYIENGQLLLEMFRVQGT